MKSYHIYVDHQFMKTVDMFKEIWEVMKAAKFLYPSADRIEIKRMGNGTDSMVWEA